MSETTSNSLSSAFTQGSTAIDPEDLLFMPMLSGIISTHPDPNAAEGNLSQGVRE